MTSAEIVAMPVAEKLRLMEELWESLCAQSGGEIASPAWHGEVLERRLRRLANGEEDTAPWPEAKERIRAQAKGH